MKIILFLSIGLLSGGCDAYVNLTYAVKNKSYNPVKVFVPAYSINVYERGTDTVLDVNPHDMIVIGRTLPCIAGSFRAGTKKLYSAKPGLCGVKILIGNDTTTIACTRQYWKLRRGFAVLTHYGPR